MKLVKKAIFTILVFSLITKLNNQIKQVNKETSNVIAINKDDAHYNFSLGFLGSQLNFKKLDFEKDAHRYFTFSLISNNNVLSFNNEIVLDDSYYLIIDGNDSYYFVLKEDEKSKYLN